MNLYFSASPFIIKLYYNLEHFPGFLFCLCLFNQMLKIEAKWMVFHNSVNKPHIFIREYREMANYESVQ